VALTILSVTGHDLEHVTRKIASAIAAVIPDTLNFVRTDTESPGCLLFNSGIYIYAYRKFFVHFASV
jgi:hypothetical protein